MALDGLRRRAPDPFPPLFPRPWIGIPAGEAESVIHRAEGADRMLYAKCILSVPNLYPKGTLCLLKLYLLCRAPGPLMAGASVISLASKACASCSPVTMRWHASS